MYRSKKRTFFLFFLTGAFVGAGIFISIQTANAAQVGGIGVSANVPPNFSISFDNNAVVITTNMKVVLNGKTVQ